jgi:hypothetical protein
MDTHLDDISSQQLEQYFGLPDETVSDWVKELLKTSDGRDNVLCLRDDRALALLNILQKVG